MSDDMQTLQELDELDAKAGITTAALSATKSFIHPVKVSADQIQFASGPGTMASYISSTMLIEERPSLQQLNTNHMNVLTPAQQVLSGVDDEPLTLWPKGLSEQLYALNPLRAGYTIALKPSANPEEFLGGFGTWRLEGVVSMDDDVADVVGQNQEKLRQHSAHHFGAAEVDDRFKRGAGPVQYGSGADAAPTTLISQQSLYASEDYVNASMRLLNAIDAGCAMDNEFEGMDLFQSTPGLASAQDPPAAAADHPSSPLDRAVSGFANELLAHPTAVRNYMTAEHAFFPGVSALTTEELEVPSDTIEPTTDEPTDAAQPTAAENSTSDETEPAHKPITMVAETKKTTDELLQDLLNESEEEKAHYDELVSSMQLVDGEELQAATLSREEAQATEENQKIDTNSNATIIENSTEKSAAAIYSAETAEEVLDAIDDVELFAKPSQLQNQPTGVSWADTTALDLSEYELLRPRLAMTHPFELDYFQKQAVMRLERRECVFVAAHTSAGKTVVAEYAIAMARKHLTRTIYTSPIKALSNQKYRDFKERFEDIGLITGDVSVNPDASCLIMTTEILRSMLYRGSDIIKDIEWVIFDEVHYVNDLERGVVWEEVIIMLPDRINLIFLSATTPNTIEFSDWIGRTKRKKVYVVSTSYRPVPLQHYLLHNEDIYPILGVDGKYNSTVVAEATKREKEKLKPKEKRPENAAMANQRQAEKAAIAAQNRGGGGGSKKKMGAAAGGGKPSSKPTGGAGGTTMVGGGRAQWNSLLKLLLAGGREGSVNSNTQAIDFGTGFSDALEIRREKKQSIVPYERLPQSMRNEMTKREYEKIEFNAGDGENAGSATTAPGCLLPVVVFCFSKKKCEEIVDFFKGQDLLTAHEKFIVRAVKAEALGRLNPSDSKLPQVVYIFDMLSRGFGVHHGGLLPILKESVEVLFSQSIVKMLIATETFAMGVNMPARSVVYHGIRKHDGRGFRDLLPGEYTQMAGRAGRRGLDKVGTVIIAAWTELPSEITLKTLITGTARKLVSQFRLSYNMILNLLRANDLNVEDMIKRSFSEFSMQRAVSNKDIHRALVKYEKFAAMLSIRISDELSALKQTGQEGLVSIMSDTHDSLRQCFELTQSFINTSVRMHPLDIEILVDTVQVSGFSAVLLQNLASAVHMGRVFISKLNGHPVVSMALSEPVYLSKEAPPVKAGTSAIGGSLSDIRRSLMAGSAAGSDTKSAKEVRAEDVLGSAFVYAVVLVPPDIGNSSVASKDALEQDTATLVTGDCTLPGGLRLTYWITKVKLSEICLIVDTVETTSLSVDPSSYVESAFQDAVGKLYPYVAPLGSTEPDTSVRALNLQRTLRRTDVDAAVTQNQLDTSSHFITAYGMHWFHDSNFQRINCLYERADSVRSKIHNIKRLMSHENLSLFPDFQQRLSVLRTLGYLEGGHGEEIVTLKGRVACEMNTCDELLATEAIFANLLEPLNPPEAAAILSAFIFQEKSDEQQQLTSRMESAKKQLKSISSRIDMIQEEWGVEVFERNRGAGDKGSTNQKKPSSSLNFGLCAVVYEWARGTSFKEITLMSDVKEGSIVRCITRVDELCRDVRNAARALGNPSLYRKMEAASQCIKRDIVFAASLYVT